ncbi:MAG: DegT/DnrJ/EryC1/StrS aminotransferase family protein [Rhodospirillales bacterium]
MNFRFPLASSSWDECEQEALSRVIASGRFSMGEEVAAFERAFAQHVGSTYAVMVNSGSSANLLMTAALSYTQNPNLKLERGDEIIVPAVSWSTTYFPLYQYGLRMKFVDIDRQTLNYDLDALAEAITDRTRAIMVVNILGNPNDFRTIENIINGRDIVMLEDNCEAMGAIFENRQAGTFGVMGTFSTFFSHHISTMEGGIVITDDEELHHILLTLRAHGWTRNLPKQNRVTDTKGDDPFEESFRFVLPGYNVRPLEMSGALGREQLKKLPRLVRQRRENGQTFQKRMCDHPKFTIQKEIGQSSWYSFSLLLRETAGLERADVLKDLATAGFECRPVVSGNFARSDVVKYFDHEIFDGLHNADYIAKNGLYIGNHPYCLAEAIEVLHAV